GPGGRVQVRRGGRNVHASLLELSGEEDLGDDRRQALGLAHDDLEEAVALVARNLDVGAQQRTGGAVNRGERRPQLVRGGRDEVASRPLERLFVADVTQRVDDALVEGDTGYRDPAVSRRRRDRHRDRTRPLGSL